MQAITQSGEYCLKGPDNCVHPVAYFSNSLKSSQRNWSTHSKEAFTIFMAVKHWGVYLAGQEIVIRSDHDPLVQLRKMKDPRGVNEKYEFRDVTTPNDYAEELKIRLKIIYEQVNTQLEITRIQMQSQYNKKLNFNDYKVGDQAWLKKKYYKTGENRKLSPRKTGPWTIIDKMQNGVNFRVRNNATTQNCSSRSSNTLEETRGPTNQYR